MMRFINIYVKVHLNMIPCYLPTFESQILNHLAYHYTDIPLYYDSLCGRLRTAKQESSGHKEFVFLACSILSNSGKLLNNYLQTIIGCILIRENREDQEPRKWRVRSSIPYLASCDNMPFIPYDRLA